LAIAALRRFGKWLKKKAVESEARQLVQGNRLDVRDLRQGNAW
jgi:hypothetical protein